jgi:hypothetical protein
LKKKKQKFKAAKKWLKITRSLQAGKLARKLTYYQMRAGLKQYPLAFCCAERRSTA